jgi:crotonobetainyl-CoA:carnitine CoA-transferase CaiB-like acyl-CoA transferase
MASKTADEVVALMDEAEVPCAKVASIGELVANPQIKHRGIVVDMEHPTVGRVPMQGLTIKFSHTPKRLRRPAPLLGQHNQEVYGRWLGLTSEQVTELQGDGAI